jgi:signal transduction histidine kinase
MPFPPTWRAALLGVIASAVIAVALGIFIPLEVRRHVLTAEARGLEAAVQALTPSLPDFSSGRLTSEQVAEADALVDRALLDADHVRAKLWSLDGTVIYSDALELIGRRFDDIGQEIGDIAATGAVKFEVTSLDEAENEFEQRYPELVEFYLPVHDGSGAVVAVFEIYEDVSFINQALNGVTTATWLAIGSGLSVLLVFLVLLMRTAVRSINRDRAAAEARAQELEVLVGAADALASSLEPDEFFAELEAKVRAGLGLSRLAIVAGPEHGPSALERQLRDGSWLIAERADRPLLPDDARVLGSLANSLDAALANASLYAEVRRAAETRRGLLRQLWEAHDDERRLLVGELHDSLAAELIRVLYGVRGIAARSGDLPEDIRAEVERLERLVADSERGLRAFMNRIRPTSLEGVGGLLAGVREAVLRFRAESHLPAELTTRGTPDGYPALAQLTVLRAAEEALLNVRKHAGATRVRVGLSVDARRLRLTVDDDGLGWPDPAAAPGEGLGLAYMRERVSSAGGRLQTGASRLGGARIVVEIPG